MKRSQEEKEKANFFRSLNSITERFLGKNYVDLDQFQQLAQFGKIDAKLNIVSDKKPFEIIKESIIKKQKVCIIKILTDVRNYKFHTLLKNEFEPICSFDDSDNKFFKDFIEKEIVPDGKIYHKIKIGLKNLRFPKVFGYGEFSDVPSPFFMEYAFPIQYSGQPKVTAFIKKYYTRTTSKNLQGIPTNVREGTIIIVGKKKEELS